MQHLWIRATCFIAAVASGVSLLAKVYGIVEMSVSVALVVLPCCIGLVVFWSWARRNRLEEVAAAVGIGIVGGLLSTLAYDLTRLPFHLSGYLVFATNSTYGMWITDAAASSRNTEVVGWLYHFSNGVTFSVMYALFMRGRHWIWAVVYAFVLESIAVFSLFGQVFSLAGNYGMVSIAYLAHISYGLPIGVMVHRWEASREWLAARQVPIAAMFTLFFASFLIPVLTPAKIVRDATVGPGVFTTDGIALVPFMQRIGKGGTVAVENRNQGEIVVRVVKTGDRHAIPAGESGKIAFPEAGIYQIHIETDGVSRSSFVIAEPVSEIPVGR